MAIDTFLDLTQGGIDGESTDQQFPKNSRLLQPLHQQSTKGGSQSDEDGRNQNGNDRVGMRKFATGKQCKNQRERFGVER